MKVMEAAAAGAIGGAAAVAAGGANSLATAEGVTPNDIFQGMSFSLFKLSF